MVNKVLLPRSERKSIASISDLILIKALTTFTSISLPDLMIEHIIKVANKNDGRHVLSYGFFITRVFEYFDVKLEKATIGTRKQMFTLGTLVECECVPKKGGVCSNSIISSLIDAQE